MTRRVGRLGYLRMAVEEADARDLRSLLAKQEMSRTHTANRLFRMQSRGVAVSAEKFEVVALLQTSTFNVGIEDHLYHTLRRGIERGQEQESVRTTPHHNSEQNSLVDCILSVFLSCSALQYCLRFQRAFPAGSVG